MQAEKLRRWKADKAQQQVDQQREALREREREAREQEAAAAARRARKAEVDEYKNRKKVGIQLCFVS